MLFDSHAHYDDLKFEEDVFDILSEMPLLGVKKIVNIGTNLESSKTSLEFAECFDFVYATVGIHPSDVNDMIKLPDRYIKLEQMLSHKKAVAIGEIGLDYYYGKENIEEQKQCFIEQMKLAERLGYPVVIHDRQAHGDCLEIIKQFKSVRGVFHSYSGSFEMAKEIMKLGYYISVNGIITFDKTKKLKYLLENIDMIHPDAKQRLLIETDCPYLAPVPKRGKRNHSGYLKYIAAEAAEIMGMEYDELCNLTYQNACEFYSIKVNSDKENI